MAWVSSGTVSVTNGSTTVTGTGTSWFGAMQNGWGFVGPDGRVYEILTVDSADTITLKTPYLGSTAAAQAYAVFPTGSHNLDLTAALQQLLSNYQGVYDTVGQGRFPGEVVFDADRDTGMGNPSPNELGLKAGDVWQLLLKGGQASGAAVQASLSDTTAGRLMLNGGHGLGAETRQVKNHDWNDANASGLFHSDSVGLNKPGFASNFAGISLRRSDTLHAQLAIALNSGVSQNARTAVRAKTGPTSWSDWFEIYTQTSILGTVAQSSGIPTGALIERGSNANGHYARFADGTQICHDRRSVSYATAQAMTATWIYPAPFSANPQVSIAIDEDNLTNNATPSIYEVLSYFDSIGTSSVRLALGRISGMTSFNSADTAGVDALAIGRWF
ncbi:MAG: hypothetical protein EpisKO_24970 [Epibacterium sp.]